MEWYDFITFIGYSFKMQKSVFIVGLKDVMKHFQVNYFFQTS